MKNLLNNLKNFFIDPQARKFLLFVGFITLSTNLLNTSSVLEACYLGIAFGVSYSLTIFVIDLIGTIFVTDLIANQKINK